MPKYRKKPVVVEAVQWTGNNKVEILEFTKETRGRHRISYNTGYFEIETLEGVMRANVGDWIIKGVKGEFYPCRPDIFAATYEPAEDIA